MFRIAAFAASVAVVFTAGTAKAESCPREPLPRIVTIMDADPEIDFSAHKQALTTLFEELRVPNTTVLLGPDVVLDFTYANEQELPIVFAACTTLTSASPSGDSWDETGAAPPTDQQSARSPQSLGPVLKFGPHRSDSEKVLLEINCSDVANDHVRISGFRLFGPSFGQQETGELGIHIVKCRDIEVSNMEIAGWGGVGVHVLDEVAGNDETGRIEQPSDVRIFGNYIHHNQHPRTVWDGHTAGYGVEVDHGAWAEIWANVFDFNRHAIAAAGDMGGYDATGNLVLKGGGVHWEFGGVHTHQFDIHGTGDNGFGGQGGVRSLFAYNSFQYLSDNAIGIRGRPSDQIVIRDNVFPHEGLEDDWGDDAIMIDDRDNLDVIELGPNNIIDHDSYGRYRVCDFDGDAIDDLFLATGQTWWFSSYGEFQWTYLATRTETLEDVRFGYFDNDLLCDVLTQDSAGNWVISSGGVGWWQSIGSFGTPLSEVEFGRFDPNIRDHRAGATKKTTHAFRRTSRGTWQVTSLASPAWRHVQTSSFPMSRLRFGDFTGDGVTDVLAVEGGEWSISESARGSWQTINPYLNDDVSNLYIADLDNNNIDDLIRLQVEQYDDIEYVTWYVSDDGRTPWRELTTYALAANPSGPRLGGYAGRFGAAPGGGVLLTDHSRMGLFFSEAEIPFVGSPDWSSLFPY